jgi:hypothetical protein
MVVASGLRKSERWAKDGTKRRGIVTDNWEAAAALWPIRRKSSNDDVPTRTYRFANAFGICRAVIGVRQEMKSGTVVPHIIGLDRLPRRNICDDPVDALGACTEPVA